MKPDMLSADQLRTLLGQARAQDASVQVCRRLEWIVHFVEHQRSISDTCRHFGISRSTFHRWIDRFDPNDLATLEGRSHEPVNVRQSEVPNHIVEFIRRYRLHTPFVGKEHIAQMVSADHGLAISPSTVGRVIERECMYFGDTPLHWRKRLEHANGHSSKQQEPIAQHPSQPVQDSIDATTSVRASSPAHHCLLCKEKTWDWSMLRSVTITASILFNLALAGMIIATALMEGQPTKAKEPTTVIPSMEQAGGRIFL